MKLNTATRIGSPLTVITATILLCLGPCGARAQEAAAPAPAADAPPAAPRQTPGVTRTFYLANSIQGANANEILIAMRNMLDPRVKIYLVMSQNAIVVQAAPDQLLVVEKLIHDLDRPSKSYRLTYTMTEVDSGKRVGTQHFAMVVVSGERTTLKQGSKIPVVTSTTAAAGAAPKSDVQYLDIGMNFSAALDEFANGVRLRSKVEQSGVSEQVSILGAQDPVVRQTVLEGTSFLTPGKPVILGSLDVSGTTRRIDIEVVMEPVP